MQLRYSREFPSSNGVKWRIEILEDTTGQFDTVGVLGLPFDEPLVIEWNETGKEEVMCGSVATLRIISPDDRTYEDLYTIEPGRIRLDVYREGSLWWSGMLDPEFYEEPYQDAKDYVVTLTFSDFGILDRLKYDLSDMKTLRELVDYAIEKSGLNVGKLAEDNFLISTCLDDGRTKASLHTLAVRSDNFYDEDGEPATLKEMLEGILQPLGLRMVQRGGKILFYDLNALYLQERSEDIYWTGESQTLGVDKVANNVKITFSPYAGSGELIPDFSYPGEVSSAAINITSDDKLYNGSRHYTYYPDYDDKHKREDRWDYNLVDFTMFIIPSFGKPFSSVNALACAFKILPITGNASECEGLAWGFMTGGHGSLASGYPVRKLNKTSHSTDAVLFKTERMFIPGLGVDDANKYYLRLSLEMLLDARYNPFSSEGDGNEKGNCEHIKKNATWVFVPVTVNLYDDSGNAMYHYTNKDIAQKCAVGHLAYAKGEWVAGSASFGDAWLEYYNAENPKGDTGILGWKKNHHCIGRADRAHFYQNNDHTGGFKSIQIYESFAKMPDGEYIPYPPTGGWLEVIVHTGVDIYRYNTLAGVLGSVWYEELLEPQVQRIYDSIRWHLYKAPEIEVVKNNLVFDSSEMDDIEYTGYINKSAKDEISIDTICGTADSVCPTARGIYCRASDGTQIHKLHRAGVTDHPEKLLIGTLYSQFAGRKTKLSGECSISASGLCKYTEANQPGKFFIMAGETQNVREDCTEATFIELAPDEYDSIEEVK